MAASLILKALNFQSNLRCFTVLNTDKQNNQNGSCFILEDGKDQKFEQLV